MEFENLVRLVSFCTTLRPGDDAETVNNFITRLKEQYNADIEQVLCSPPNVSSTQIRQNVANGIGITGMVCDKVEQYIYRYNLYGGKDDRR